MKIIHVWCDGSYRHNAHSATQIIAPQFGISGGRKHGMGAGIVIKQDDETLTHSIPLDDYRGNLGAFIAETEALAHALSFVDSQAAAYVHLDSDDLIKSLGKGELPDRKQQSERLRAAFLTAINHTERIDSVHLRHCRDKHSSELKWAHNLARKASLRALTATG